MTRYFNILYNWYSLLFLMHDPLYWCHYTSVAVMLLCQLLNYIWYCYNVSLNNWLGVKCSITSMTETLWVNLIQRWRKINIQIITIKCYDWWDPYVSTQTVNIVFWNVMCIMNLYIALSLLNFHFSCIHAVSECRINSVEPVTHPCAFSVFSDSPDIVWIQVNTLLVTLF